MNLLPDILWRMPDDNVYLTFDDGPQPAITPGLLELLNEFNVPATFFCVGMKAARHPEIVRQICAGGHVVGNHSYTHPVLLGKKREFILEEVSRTDNALAQITEKKPALFRPPYGKFGADLLSILKSSGQRMVLWNASAQDYKTERDANAIARTIRKLAKPGKIILLHDGHANSRHTLDALRQTLGELISRGVTFSSIPETRS